MNYSINGDLITNIANTLRSYSTAGESNLIKISIDTDGTIYNGGTGWKYGYRLNSSGVEKADDMANPQSVTGYIPASKGDVFLFTGFNQSPGYDNHIFCYDASFNVVAEIDDVSSNETFVSTTVTVDCAFIRVSAMFGEGAIIEKQGAVADKETYKLAEMPSAINQVYNKGVNDGKGSVAVNLQTKTVTPKSSSQTVSPDSGYDGLSKVTVNAVPTETKSITANGTYTPSSGKFFSSVSVAVPASGITPSGTIEIDENGTFDVTNFAQAIVNVASSGGGSVCVTGEVNANSATKLTIDTGKADAKFFVIYADETSLSSSLVYMFLITPLISASFRYSGSSASTTVFLPTTTTAIAGSLTNGVAVCDTKASYGFAARKYKWIAW